jgi:ribosomal protein S18 acetylase RimI-like enzyme
MTIRPATESELERLGDLYQAFRAELDEPAHLWRPWEDVRDEVELRIRDGLVLLADEEGRSIGFVFVKLESRRLGWIGALYVEPSARERGVAKALLRAAVERVRRDGADHVALEVGARNTLAQQVYRRLGFAEDARVLSAEAGPLVARLEAAGPGASYGSVHVQTDDETAVERALAQFLPRLGRSAWTEVVPAANGWVTVTDELCDHDRNAQRRLGTELSERLGVPVVAFALEEEAVVRFLLFDRGRLVDEYLSVPTYYGELNRADELSLAANPTLVSRLTGAEPARVRAVARIASSPAELPPARQLLREIAAVMNLEARIER